MHIKLRTSNKKYLVITSQWPFWDLLFSVLYVQCVKKNNYSKEPPPPRRTKLQVCKIYING